MNYHNQTTEDALRQLGTDGTRGLCDDRASELLREHGKNALKEKKKKSLFMKFIDQFKDAMILILIAAAAVSFTLACIEAANGQHAEFFEPILILVIVHDHFCRNRRSCSNNGCKQRN